MTNRKKQSVKAMLVSSVSDRVAKTVAGSPSDKARRRFMAASTAPARRTGVFPALKDMSELELLEASTVLTTQK